MMEIEGLEIAQVEPRCPHFGVCGGCQIQMAAYADQLLVKQRRLRGLLAEAGVNDLPELLVHSAEPWGYRNRVRLRLQRVDGVLRAGYNRGSTTEFLPITTCPIAAPVLWHCAEALLEIARNDRGIEAWLDTASAVEIFCNDAKELRVTLHCPTRKIPPGRFAAVVETLAARGFSVVSAAAFRVDSRSGQLLKPVAEFGAAGLKYRVGDETYWIRHGGFFQVNRFLLEELVHVVCAQRAGALAWDLFAGVGLFSRVLARRFTQVTAVEFDAVAAATLASSLGTIGATHRGVQANTTDFLRAQMVQREHPDLVVLDPPRAGAGLEACDLLLRVNAAEVVYVSCDPGTLARDLQRLQTGYRISEMHLVDLFPQTNHQETVVVLRRKS